MARAQGQTVVQVEGLRELKRRLRRIEGGLADLKTEHRWVSDFVLGRARPSAPRRSGRLAATMRGSGTVSASVLRVGTARVPYAGPIHYGWPARDIAAQPWLIDAAQQSEPVWSRHFNETITDLVERTSAQ